ncbi:MAG: hypothetical protein HYR88_13845 [Verrucomicrobia bacterium]|nr:hypothetical protein [Verrucomicrobiota bacterium]MBI3869390.1 hypothetical protein [Verrucomicrobiota bacterium]
MKCLPAKPATRHALRSLLAALLFLGLASTGRAALTPFIAFNDSAPGLGTGPNVTSYGLAAASATGPLKNVGTGKSAGVTLTTTNSGAAAGGVQGRPDYGSPASTVFEGYVDFGGQPDPGIEIGGATDIYTLVFSGLDPAAEYNFQGTAIRGNINYRDRWSVFEIVGADSFTSRHTAGAVTRAIVATLTDSQVVINTGDNRSGDMAWWEHIRSGSDGKLAIQCRQYLGKVPGRTTSGGTGYGITGFRLEQAGAYSGRTELPLRVPNPLSHALNGISTVFLVVMENHNWDTILTNTYCPYINHTLLPKASYAQRYYSALGVHPSEPNYMWMIAGGNFGIRDDQAPSVNHQSSTNTLFHQLDAAGIPWKCYAEDITGKDIPSTNKNAYAVRHVPFVFFDTVRTNLDYCTNHIRPFTELAFDLTNGTAPRFCYIVPNVTNDMHDLTTGSPSTRKQGDDWLAREMPKILNSPSYTNGGALFLTWDEGGGDSDGPVGMIVLSPRAKGGAYHNNTFYTHSSLLRTLQDIFDTRPYLGDAVYADDLSDLFKTIRLDQLAQSDGKIRFVINNVIPGKTHYVQAASGSASAVWTNIKTNVPTQATVPFEDSLNASDVPLFYRVLELP